MLRSSTTPFLRAWSRAIVVGVVLLALAQSARAQVGSAAITGIVSDPDGAPLPGVAVTAASVTTRRVRQVTTNADGRFAVGGLASGLYEISVVVSGFRPLTRGGVRAATGETIRLDLGLEIGIAEAIQVTADAPLLRSEASGLGQVIDNRKVTTLPLNGRSFITLAALAPGVALPPASSLPRINGGRPRTNEYLFDGISVLQPEPGQVAFFPNVDAIQDFKIESNSPPAEFGRFNGGVVNLTTKTGGNRLQGSVFEFLRHEALNARNFFASADPVKPTFRRQQFGGVMGGPLRQDRSFFFVDYQGQRQTIGRTVISTVPTSLQRGGIFTEPIAGRVPTTFDPATGASARTPFLGNVIPADPRWRASRRRSRLRSSRSSRPSPSGRSTTSRRRSRWRMAPASRPSRSRQRPASARACSPSIATSGPATHSSGMPPCSGS